MVGAPFIYEDDTKEFDFEFTRWNVATNNNRCAPMAAHDTECATGYTCSIALQPVRRQPLCIRFAATQSAGSRWTSMFEALGRHLEGW